MLVSSDKPFVTPFFAQRWHVSDFVRGWHSPFFWLCRPARSEQDACPADRPACDVDSATVEVQRGDETRDAETAATRPYPDPPTAVAEDDLLEYVESFDHAFVTQSILCDQSQSEEILQIGYSLETYERIDRGKIHARGPVGLEGLTTYKYHLEGDGHIVATYAGEDAKPYLHEEFDGDWLDN